MQNWRARLRYSILMRISMWKRLCERDCEKQIQGKITPRTRRKRKTLWKWINICENDANWRLNRLKIAVIPGKLHSNFQESSDFAQPLCECECVRVTLWPDFLFAAACRVCYSKIYVHTVNVCARVLKIGIQIGCEHESAWGDNAAQNWLLNREMATATG